MYIPVGLNCPPYNVYNFIYNVNRASLLNMKINKKNINISFCLLLESKFVSII